MSSISPTLSILQSVSNPSASSWTRQSLFALSVSFDVKPRDSSIMPAIVSDERTGGARRRKGNGVEEGNKRIEVRIEI